MWKDKRRTCGMAHWQGKPKEAPAGIAITVSANEITEEQKRRTREIVPWRARLNTVPATIAEMRGIGEISDGTENGWS